MKTRGKVTVAALSTLVLTGCAGIPKIGEGEKEYVTSFPHHPAIILLHGGSIHAKGLEEGVDFRYEHWTGIKGGSHFVFAEKEERGYNAWGSILGCYSNVRWAENGRHLMETTSYNNNLTKVTKREFFELKKDKDRWKKERLTKKEWNRIRRER